MWQRKRKVKLRRQTQKKHRFTLPIILAVIVLLIGSMIYAVFYLLNKPLFVSPVGILTMNHPEPQEQKSVDRVKHLLKQNKIAFKSIKLSSQNTVIISLRDQGEVILNSKGNIEAQISSLQYILTRLTMEGKRFSRLDMEFNKPIINF